MGRVLPGRGPLTPAPSATVSPQGSMFRCSARCCEDAAASMQEVQRCIERCHAPLAQAQAIVTAELEHFQVSCAGDNGDTPTAGCGQTH